MAPVTPPVPTPMRALDEDGDMRPVCRAGEMINWWRGLGPGGPEEKGPLVSQRAQNHLYLQLGRYL